MVAPPARMGTIRLTGLLNRLRLTQGGRFEQIRPGSPLVLTPSRAGRYEQTRVTVLSGFSFE